MGSCSYGFLSYCWLAWLQQCSSEVCAFKLLASMPYLRAIEGTHFFTIFIHV